MKWLRQINEYTPLVVANPIKGLDGKNIQQVRGMDGKDYFCVICEYLPGEAPDENNEEQMVRQFRYLGGNDRISSPADRNLERNIKA